MTEEQKQKYSDEIAAGNLPEQETYTQEEMKYLALSLLTWAGLQVEHTLDEALHDDIPDLIAQCEYKSIEHAIKDVEDAIEEDFLGLKDFFVEYFTMPIKE